LKLPFYIARRYFFSRKTGGGFSLISVISAISLLGYIVGAAALVIVLSVFNGFETLFTSLYSNFDSDLRIISAEGKTINSDAFKWDVLKKTEGVYMYSSVVEENVLLRYNNQQAIATLKGVDKNYSAVTGFDSTVIAGHVDVQRDSVFAVVGQGIAYRLSVDPEDIFKALAIYVPKRNVQSFINPDDAFSKALVFPGAVFSVQEEVDDKYVICPISFAMDLLARNDEITAIEISLKPGYRMNRIKDELQEALGGRYQVKNRFEQHESFFKVMRSEKAISYIILLFILLIAASNTIGSLYILVTEKKRDLEIMNSMGISEKQAVSIFRYQGFIIAFTGGAGGIALGLLLCFLQDKYGFVSLQNAANVIFSSYPVKVIWSDVLLVFITVMVLGYLTTIYPARKARSMLHSG
jgi:lipoprotein-releasing system permease protein